MSDAREKAEQAASPSSKPSHWLSIGFLNCNMYIRPWLLTQQKQEAGDVH
jgi:hypothetical protein